MKGVEIHVMSSLAVKAAYLELVPRFESASGHRAVTQWVGGVDIARRQVSELLPVKGIDFVGHGLEPAIGE